MHRQDQISGSLPIYVVDTAGSGWEIHVGQVFFTDSNPYTSIILRMDFEHAKLFGVDLTRVVEIFDYLNVEADIRSKYDVKYVVKNPIIRPWKEGAAGGPDSFADYVRLPPVVKPSVQALDNQDCRNIPAVELQQKLEDIEKNYLPDSGEVKPLDPDGYTGVPNVILISLLSRLQSGRIILNNYDIRAARNLLESQTIVQWQYGDPVRYLIEMRPLATEESNVRNLEP